MASGRIRASCANFFALLLTALLPAAVFVIGIRTPRSVVEYGSALLGVTLLGWIFILEDDPMRGVGAVLAFPVTLVSSAVGAIHDHRRRQREMTAASASPSGQVRLDDAALSRTASGISAHPSSDPTNPAFCSDRTTTELADQATCSCV